MTIYYEHTHDRDACDACAKNRAIWGPEGDCGRIHELNVGDKVRIRGGEAVWTVNWASPGFVTVERPRKGLSRSRRFFAKERSRDGGRDIHPITDLVPLHEYRVENLTALEDEIVLAASEEEAARLYMRGLDLSAYDEGENPGDNLLVSRA